MKADCDLPKETRKENAVKRKFRWVFGGLKINTRMQGTFKNSNFSCLKIWSLRNINRFIYIVSPAQ